MRAGDGAGKRERGLTQIEITKTTFGRKQFGAHHLARDERIEMAAQLLRLQLPLMARLPEKTEERSSPCLREAGVGVLE